MGNAEPSDEVEARKHPELAVLSAAAHAGEPDGAEPVAAALVACEGLPTERATLYADLIFSRLDQAALAALEALMQHRKHEYQSEFARKYFTQGLEEGREEERRSLLQRLLAQRFGALPADVVQRVAQADMDTLEQWIERVIPARALTDVFKDG